MHLSTQVWKNLKKMGDGIQKEVTVHKDGKPGCVKSDREDREKIIAKLKRCIDPFDTKSHPIEIINIS